MVDMMGGSISTASSSTLVHQVLRLRVRWTREFIGIISCYATHSTLTSLYLMLCRIRERSSATEGYVSDYSVANRAVSSSAAVSAETQSAWRRPLATASVWEDSSIEGQTLPLSTLLQSLELAPNLSAYATV